MFSVRVRAATVAMQRRCKHASSTIETVFFVWSVQSGYKEEFSCEELVEFRDASLPGYELGCRGIELSRVFGMGSCRIMAKKGIRL
jgi:hypothetical protein